MTPVTCAASLLAVRTEREQIGWNQQHFRRASGRPTAMHKPLSLPQRQHALGCRVVLHVQRPLPDAVVEPYATTHHADDRETIHNQAVYNRANVVGE